jgi:hypothetical protein
VKKTELQRLTAIWNKKLKRSGFVDAEDHLGRLKVYDSFYFQATYSSTAFKAKERYFQLAQDLLNTHQFRSKRQKAIWALHCEGRSQEIIAKKHHISRQRVGVILAELAVLLRNQ